MQKFLISSIKFDILQHIVGVNVHNLRHLCECVKILEPGIIKPPPPAALDDIKFLISSLNESK